MKIENIIKLYSYKTPILKANFVRSYTKLSLVIAIQLWRMMCDYIYINPFSQSSILWIA